MMCMSDHVVCNDRKRDWRSPFFYTVTRSYTPSRYHLSETECLPASYELIWINRFGEYIHASSTAIVTMSDQESVVTLTLSDSETESQCADEAKAHRPSMPGNWDLININDDTFDVLCSMCETVIGTHRPEDPVVIVQETDFGPLAVITEPACHQVVMSAQPHPRDPDKSPFTCKNGHKIGSVTHKPHMPILPCFTQRRLILMKSIRSTDSTSPSYLYVPLWSTIFKMPVICCYNFTVNGSCRFGELCKRFHASRDVLRKCEIPITRDTGRPPLDESPAKDWRARSVSNPANKPFSASRSEGTLPNHSKGVSHSPNSYSQVPSNHSNNRPNSSRRPSYSTPSSASPTGSLPWRSKESVLSGSSAPAASSITPKCSDLKPPSGATWRRKENYTNESASTSSHVTPKNGNAGSAPSTSVVISTRNTTLNHGAAGGVTPTDSNVSGNDESNEMAARDCMLRTAALASAMNPSVSNINKK
ncbi:hypothetical protein SeMB42_g03394 [Synchytrium endobioticum]|uniref:C3H1-type domain-containing protein n=1 Tax=Synchytrium endobioticum TaxID=286115 RepID=A0A507D8S2_9FUNG|nr:hypothetical protein SeMB42_g03394 [Synchytrium endobioticum]